jgi:hypothetical protein
MKNFKSLRNEETVSIPSINDLRIDTNDNGFVIDKKALDILKQAFKLGGTLNDFKDQLYGIIDTSRDKQDLLKHLEELIYMNKLGERIQEVSPIEEVPNNYL